MLMCVLHDSDVQCSGRVYDDIVLHSMMICTVQCSALQWGVQDQSEYMMICRWQCSSSQCISGRCINLTAASVTAFHCIPIYFNVFQCIFLYFNVFHCIKPYLTAFQRISPYISIFHCISLYFTVFQSVSLNCFALYLPAQLYVTAGWHNLCLILTRQNLVVIFGTKVSIL